MSGSLIKRLILLVFCLNLALSVNAAEPLRRPISASQPAWIIHIDVWNNADPQKIIDMVPEDVRPYVIFNIATSSSDNRSMSGPAIYDSWLKVCAQNRVWAMIQCASGAPNRMPDDGSTSAYEQYFKDYPNFLGFNFAEQFWGFGDDGAVTFAERLQLMADLMPVCHQYGGYLAVSFCDSYYNASKMPIAYMKRNGQMRSWLTNHPEHFLCFEKYTLKKNFFDIESNCLGAWLGGYAGQYGIRFDSSGWLAADDVTDMTKGGSTFVRAAGAIPIAEHMMLTGETMMDGPELTWTECSEETSTTTDADGYTHRNWRWFPQFENINLDLFRKVLDGTIRIPTRQEVIGRTKICIVNDINSNLSNEAERNSYITPATLFDGLYRSESDHGGLNSDNSWLDNRWWLKRTGRYPTIPQVYGLLDNDARALTAVKKSEYSTRWATVDAKVSEMNQLFPEEYTGDIYAGRHENGWVTYNPYQYDESETGGYRVCTATTRRAQGNIPFQYNTCESVSLDYAPYSLGIIKEYAGKVTVYLSNYQTTGTMSEDIIKIYGATRRPTYSWNDRGTDGTATFNTQWRNNVYTITVKHNGPVDVTINCSGTATDRKSAYTSAIIQVPAAPPAYEGTLQYEAEHADYQQAICRANAYGLGHDGYYGQGYAELTSEQSALRDTITPAKAGYYLLTVRYQSDTDGSMIVTGNDFSTVLQLSKSNTWTEATAMIKLKAEAQPLILRNSSATTVLVDCIQLNTATVAEFALNQQGEYHVDMTKLIATGSVSIDATTGKVTQTAGGQNSGSLSLLLNHADFSEVETMVVTYDGDGDIFKSLLITDGNGTSVNSSSNGGAFWSSRYMLNYTDYQSAAASHDVCKLEWTANNPASTTRTMTIHDIMIKGKATTGIRTIDNLQFLAEPSGKAERIIHNNAPMYNLAGQKVGKEYRGIVIVKDASGKGKKVKR